MENLETEYLAQKCWGMVASVDVYSCDRNIITSADEIRKFIVELCNHVDMVRHGEAQVERFAEGELEGFSAMQFIETSSITLHFDELENRGFIDIFSCKFFDPKKAENFCREYLKGSSSKSLHYFRK